MRVQVNIDDAGVRRVLDRLAERARNLAPAMREIGGTVVADAQMRFKASKDPYGVPWRRLARRTIAQRRGKSDKPLLDTGRLRNSITYRLIGQHAVEIGSNVEYAAIHQFGGTVQHGARSLKVRLRQIVVKRADGTSYKAARFAKDTHKRAAEKWGTNSAGWSVKIPARPYLATRERGLPREYGEIIRDALARHFAKAAA